MWSGSLSEESGTKSEGFLVVRKPAGMTSHDLVALIRRRLGAKRVGHAGTLDPTAEGVMILGVGRGATKKLGAFLGADKEYEAVMVLGVSTDSQDAAGSVVSEKDARGITEAEIRRACERFTGLQQQIPPMHSALKHEGQPLYRLARKGIVVPRRPRTITVHLLDLLGVAGAEVRLRIVCSKGTYVRTLVADMGDALGCGAHLKYLVRTRVGAFTLDSAVPLDELLALSREALAARLIPSERAEGRVS